MTTAKPQQFITIHIAEILMEALEYCRYCQLEISMKDGMPSGMMGVQAAAMELFCKQSSATLQAAMDAALEGQADPNLWQRLDQFKREHPISFDENFLYSVANTMVAFSRGLHDGRMPRGFTTETTREAASDAFKQFLAMVK